MPKENSDSYDQLFYETMDRDAQRSARIILPLILNAFDIRSVADFGCGNGEWLRVWKTLGAKKVVGIDGSFVDRSRLLIGVKEFTTHDLRKPIQLGTKFDLVQSLEVAEHLPNQNSESFIDSLVVHSDRVLFSAAVPGQMGIEHINEQPHSFWQRKFEDRGYVLFDWIRPQIRDQLSTAYWYRYNTFLFIHETRLEELPETVLRSRIPNGRAVRDVSPFGYRLQRSIMRWLPVAVMNQLTRYAHRWRRKPADSLETRHSRAA